MWKWLVRFVVLLGLLAVGEKLCGHMSVIERLMCLTVGVLVAEAGIGIITFISDGQKRSQAALASSQATSKTAPAQPKTDLPTDPQLTSVAPR